jgi:hypothetical protein
VREKGPPDKRFEGGRRAWEEVGAAPRAASRVPIAAR